MFFLFVWYLFNKYSVLVWLVADMILFIIYIIVYYYLFDFKTVYFTYLVIELFIAFCMYLFILIFQYLSINIYLFNKHLVLWLADSCLLIYLILKQEIIHSFNLKYSISVWLVANNFALFIQFWNILFICLVSLFNVSIYLLNFERLLR